MILTIALGIVLAVIILTFLPVILVAVGAFFSGLFSVVLAIFAVIFPPKEPATEQEIKQSIIKDELKKAYYKKKMEAFFNFIILSCLLLLGLYLQLLSIGDVPSKLAVFLVILSVFIFGYFFYYSRKLKKLGKAIGSQDFRHIMMGIFVIFFVPWIMLVVFNLFD